MKIYRLNNRKRSIMNINKCRICLENTNSLINIFNSSMIMSKIERLANIEIDPNDGLPASICIICNKKLNECIEFINLCKKSDYSLKKLITETIEVNKETSIGSPKDNCILAPHAINIDNEKKTDDKDVVRDELSINQYNLSEEKKLSDKQQCFTCGKIMSSRFRLKTHLATHQEKQHSCPYCKKKFTIAENMNSHMRIHTGEKPYTCSECGKTFAQSSGLIVHKRKHTGETPYKCVLCPRSFQTLANFKYHVRVHTGERKYNCSICGRAFITNSDLRQHLATHNGEKPHICCVCGMRFSRGSNLNRHVVYVHTERKLFPCEQCPSKFMRKCDLVKHECSHKNKSTKT